MKILFICGSLEFGKDGVGDYTRRLAIALQQQGHTLAIIALNDAYVQEVADGFQNFEDEDVKVLRIPATMYKVNQLNVVKNWITGFAPDNISIQFVPFAFHPKGLCTTLAKQLLFVAGKAKWHIMVHELWAGMNKEAPFKLKVLGLLQKKIIVGLLKALNPVISTQSSLYFNLLKKLNFKCDLLPLFSNIPVIEQNIKNEREKRSSQLKLILFGSIHHDAPAQILAKKAVAFASHHQQQVLLQVVGRTGPAQTFWANTFKAQGCPVEITGEIEPRQVSALLSGAFAGISTTPYCLSEKSGAVAAMLAHGLPVISVSNSWNPSGNVSFSIPTAIHQFQQENLFQSLYLKNDEISGLSPAKIATKMISKLS